MPRVRIYTTRVCPYCLAAKELLRQKGVAFEEIDLTDPPEARVRLQEQTGRATVPQIFIGEKHVGGFDDLKALDHRGELDRLLQGA
ncbi:MAG: glutaredoxin 3 [Deltaproteobacteria bacterium RBG_13_61_14]|nr:MAG: glutaredoxin 3 [Deltaproteobacteria bacterium RBG_13_61_14]